MINIVHNGSMLRRLTDRWRPGAKKDTRINLALTCLQLSSEVLPYWRGRVTYSIIVPYHLDDRLDNNLKHCQRDVKHFCATMGERLVHIKHVELDFDHLQSRMSGLVQAYQQGSLDLSNANQQYMKITGRSYDRHPRKIEVDLPALRCWPKTLCNITTVTLLSARPWIAGDMWKRHPRETWPLLRDLRLAWVGQSPWIARYRVHKSELQSWYTGERFVNLPGFDCVDEQSLPSTGAMQIARSHAQTSQASALVRTDIAGRQSGLIRGLAIGMGSTSLIGQSFSATESIWMNVAVLVALGGGMLHGIVITHTWSQVSPTVASLWTEMVRSSSWCAGVFAGLGIGLLFGYVSCRW